MENKSASLVKEKSNKRRLHSYILLFVSVSIYLIYLYFTHEFSDAYNKDKSLFYLLVSYVFVLPFIFQLLHKSKSCMLAIACALSPLVWVVISWIVIIFSR